MLKPGCTTALFVVVVSLAIPAAAQSPKPAEMSSAAMPSVAPLFIESGDFTSALNLVNELRVPVQATVDVYSLDGVKAASETITMVAYSSRQLSMESIFAGAVPLQLGSIRVSADHTSGLLAALSLTHRGSPATYFDEELAMPSMEGSSVARGVADDARGGTPITAITSLSSSPQNITLSCVPESGAARQRTLELAPNQTLLMRPCAGDLPAAVLSPSDIENAGSGAPASGSRTAAAIAVTSDAMPGEFAVYGIVPHESKDNPFFTSINFSDPKTRRSSGSTYVGIPVGPSPLLTDGSYSPEISIANFGPTAATITLESASTVNGAPQRITLATIVLAGGESRTVPLSNMPLSPGLTNGLRIHTDAAPGDVLSKLVSRGGSQLPVVEMLDKDERGAFNGGGHPWDVEPGVTSTLLLFNGDSTPQKVNLRFGTATGPWMRRFTLEPMETRAINVNELIGMQEKDDSGLALPSNALSGELGWQSDSTWVSGRLLQTSAALGMARSFSCSQWVYACSFALSPTPSLTLYLNNVGGLSEIPDWAVYTGFHPPTTCSCANPSSGNTTLYDSWQSGNTSIATITSGGTSSASVWQGVGVGGTTSYFYGTNMFLGGGSLMCQTQEPAVDFQFVVAGKPFIFVGKDPNEAYANSYYATNGSQGYPKPSGGTYSASSADSNDTVVASQGPPPVAKVTTTDQSKAVGDRKLTFEYEVSGATAMQTMYVTAREFAYATNNTPSNQCTLGYGTKSYYIYTIYTHPDGLAVDFNSGLSGTAVTESFNPPISCGAETGDGALDSAGQFTDHVVYCSNKSLTCTQIVTQTLSVAGYVVRTNTFTYSSRGMAYARKGPSN